MLRGPLRCHLSMRVLRDALLYGDYAGDFRLSRCVGRIDDANAFSHFKCLGFDALRQFEHLAVRERDRIAALVNGLDDSDIILGEGTGGRRDEEYQRNTYDRAFHSTLLLLWLHVAPTIELQCGGHIDNFLQSSLRLTDEPGYIIAKAELRPQIPGRDAW